MQLNCNTASSFLIYSTSFALKWCIPSSGDNNIDSATRLQRVQSIITHGITDKAAYLSEATEEHLSFLAWSFVSSLNRSYAKYNTYIISRHDAIHFQTGFKPPMEVD